jgi:photosystem II stability/assembly factor-like uncharacterized protein
MQTINELGVCSILCCAASGLAQTPDQDHVAANVFGQMTWKELGPVAFGGRIVDIAVHPQNPSVFWLAAASGGLWKSTNAGISFTPQFQDAYSISIGDIAIAPSQPDTIWVGTGEANNQRSSYWGNGVHKSTDGGKTFAHCGLDGTDHIGRIVVHPKNADVVWVAALGALYSPNKERGLWRTRDGGKSWQCTKHLGNDTGFVDVVVDPQNPDVLFAASYERRRRAWNLTEGGEGSRIWKSLDGGETWERLAGGLPAGTLGRIGLDLCASDPKVVYATIENLNPAEPQATEPARIDGEREPDNERKDPAATPDAEVLADPLAAAEWRARADLAQDPQRRPRRRTVGGEVYRSDDAGKNWKKVNTTRIGGEPGYYYGQIRVDPRDANTAYVLSVPVYKTTDGGKTWSGGGQQTFARGLHVDHHALWIDPQDSRHLLLGNDGGFAVTFDGGKNWDHVNRLPIAQFYAIGVDRRSPYRVYGGLQDNGTWGFPSRGASSAGLGIHDAYRIDGGDGFYVCCDPDDPDIVYSESQFGGMSRQNLRTGERKGIKPRADKGSPALRFNWMTPIVLSPHDPRTVYTGSQYLHRSRNRGDSWTTISPDLTTNDPDKLKGNVPHCTVTTIAESPKKEGWLLVGTDDGRVSSTKDGGGRWTDLSDRFPAACRGLWVSRVEYSPHAEGTAFVTFTGYREDRRAPFVFRTDDGGETFRDIANNLPDEPVNVIRQHPRTANVLLAGTEMGAFVSIDDGGTWHRFGSGLPRCAVHDLAVHPDHPHVLVGTHGRGIWAVDATALEGLTEAVLAKDFHVFAPSDGVLLRRGPNRGSQGARTWSAPNPFVNPTFRYHLREDADKKPKLEVLDATGRVLWTHEGSEKAGYHEVSWGGGRGGFPGGGEFFGGGGRRGGGQGGVRAGQFALRVTHGESTSTQAFRVADARGPRSALGGIPGHGDASAPEEEQEGTQSATAHEEEPEIGGR